MSYDTVLLQKFAVILSHLGEKQQRWLLITEVRLLGHGGISPVTLHRASLVLRFIND
jgi:hypothetical protein